MCYNQSCVCGRSSSGRARPCQGRGSEFEPRRPLQKETPSERMVFLFGMTRAEARTGHERSEKNVPVARFGARVRVAALSAASEPRRRLGCAALVVSSDWPSHLCPPVRTHPKNRLAFPAAGSASAVFPLRQPSGGHIRGRQTGRCLESGLLHLPQAALRRFPRRPLQKNKTTLWEVLFFGATACQRTPVLVMRELAFFDRLKKPPRKRWFFDFVTRRPAYPAAAPPPIRRTAWPAPAGWRCWGLPRRSPIC